MTNALDALLSASRGWSGDSPDGRILSTTRAFLAAATSDPAELQSAAASLDGLDRGAAVWLSLTCGTVAESGIPAEIFGAALLTHFPSWLPDLPASLPDGAGCANPTAGQESLLKLFQFLCQSMVSHLARLPEHRKVLGQDLKLLERLDDLGACSFGALWVREALTKNSDTVLLLHVAERQGVRLRYTNVSNCFHLFSLLQTAVGTALPGGRTPDETVAAVARGKRVASISDEAWWHYGNPLVPRAELTASIWGESLARDIPRVDGQQMMLLWPPQLKARSWDSAFLQPHLDAMPADASVDAALLPAEMAHWLDRITTAPAAGKQGWRSWLKLD